MKRTLLSILLLTPYSLSTGAAVNQSTTAFDMVDIAQIEAIKKWRYSVQLSSASTQTEPDYRLAQLNIKQKLVYIVKARSQNHTWYRMRLGFFDNYAEAQKAANEVRKVYPDAWVTKAPTEEINYFLAGKYLTFLITASGSKQLSSTAAVSASPAEVKHNSPEGYLLKTATPIKAPIAAPLSDGSTLQSRTASKTEGRLKSLMERARQAMIDKQYNRAIELYNNVLREAESIYSPKALELMGLALERKGQLARARESYRRFLKQYPKHEGYTRVKQRLDALITAAALPK